MLKFMGLMLIAGNIRCGLSAVVSESHLLWVYVFLIVQYLPGRANRLKLMYALPHHVKTFHNSTVANIHRVFKLPSPANGMMYGVIANTWRLRVESLPVEIGWLPLGEKGCASFPPEVLQRIHTIARIEVAQNLTMQTRSNPSMYFAGKV